TTLATFNGTNGATPQASLFLDSNKNLVGTTYGGGAYGDGTVFAVEWNGSSYKSTVTDLVSFNGTNGANPTSSVIRDKDNRLCGTTTKGGGSSDGTVFDLSSGTVDTL